MKGRSVAKVVLSKWQSEGRGARVRRSIGRQELRNLDPFLLLDEFEGSGKDGGGFPDHPHRGFETVSYLLEGEFTHEDFAGNHGVLRPGDLQWMTAGRGIVHSEMPGWEKTRGLQLWVNLAREYKMVEPSYQELLASEIPSAATSGVTVKVIAGSSMGIKSPVRTRTPTFYLDFKFLPGSNFTQDVPADWTCFAYILAGKFRFGGGEVVEAHNTVLFDTDGDGVEMEETGHSDSEGHLVLIAGRPIGEKVVQHGPFVMNTRQEIEQAFEDYQLGKNGFEKIKTWKSIEGNK